LAHLITEKASEASHSPCEPKIHGETRRWI